MFFFKLNDLAIIGDSLCKIKQIKDDKGNSLTSASPSYAVELSGLKELPEGGDVMFVINNEIHAKYIASRRKAKKKSKINMKDIIVGETSPKLKFETKREKRKFYSGNKDFIREKIEESEDKIREV